MPLFTRCRLHAEHLVHPFTYFFPLFDILNILQRWYPCSPLRQRENGGSERLSKQFAVTEPVKRTARRETQVSMAPRPSCFLLLSCRQELCLGTHGMASNPACSKPSACHRSLALPSAPRSENSPHHQLCLYSPGNPSAALTQSSPPSIPGGPPTWVSSSHSGS